MAITKKKNPLLDDEVEEAERKELRELQEEQALRLEEQGFKFYEPNGKCEEFIAAVGSGEYFIVYISAANGVGKTAAGANVVANIVFESENEYFDHPLYKKFPFPNRGRIASDPKNVDNIVKTLKEWMPAGQYESKKAGKSYDSKWWIGEEKHPEWEWDIMTYEQDAKEYEGDTLGWAWFDEPPPEAIFKATVARMRKGGIIFITATPLMGSAWMYDKLTGGETEVEGLNGEKIIRKIKHIEADVEAACKQHGVRGHLEHAHIQQMIAEYDEDERWARAFGKFQHLAGIVFKGFTREVHVIAPFQIDRKNFCVYEMLDPHPRNNDAVMWVAIDRMGRKFVCNELWLKCRNGTEELAQNIKGIAQQYRIVRRLADPSAFIEDQHTQKSLASRLSDNGLSYLEASKARAASDRRIADAMAYTRLPNGEFIKAPEVFIFSTCTRTIYEIEHYRWSEWKGKVADERDRKEKPVDKDDHMIENLGRCLFQEPVFVPYVAAPQQYSSGPLAHDDPYDGGSL
jgi:phage terminase large subunit-like protein